MNTISSYNEFTPSSSLLTSILLVDAQTLHNTNSAIPGMQYWITDAATNVVDKGIVVTGTPNGKLSLEGHGGFLNPDYQGVGDYSGVETYTGNPFNEFRGIHIDGNDTHVLGDVVIWNGFHYVCIDDSSGGIDIGDSGAWQLLPKDTPNVGYIEEWDMIEYDLNNNWIQSREDKRGNIVKRSHIEYEAFGGDNPFKFFQWGNDNVTGNKANNLYSVVCINNLGSIRDCNFYGTYNVTGGNFNLPISRSINMCEFYLPVDFSNLQVDYGNKILSPHLSTFDATITISPSTLIDGVLQIPPYCGIINVFQLNDGPVSDFSETPRFPITISPAGGDAGSLDSEGRFSFTQPYLSVYLTGFQSVTFLYDPNSNRFYEINNNLPPVRVPKIADSDTAFSLLQPGQFMVYYDQDAITMYLIAIHPDGTSQHRIALPEL